MFHSVQLHVSNITQLRGTCAFSSTQRRCLLSSVVPIHTRHHFDSLALDQKPGLISVSRS